MIPVLWWCASVALAGGGPWIQPTGQASVFLGVDSQKFEHFALSGGNLSTDTVHVDEGISTLLFKSFVTYGLTPRSEVEIGVPYGFVRANRTDGDPASVCTSLGLDACAPNQGLAPITLRAKVSWLEQAYGAPLSGGVGLELRYENQTADERAQLTNLGEGTFDTGLFASAGRSASLPGNGYYYTYLEVLGRYRVPTATVQGHGAPGSELQVGGDLIVVPDGKLGFGPTISLFDRPSGEDFETVDLTDVDRFAALRVRNWSAGGKLTLSASPKASASLTVLRTLYAENNPLITSVGFGLSFSDILRARDATAEE